MIDQESERQLNKEDLRKLTSSLEKHHAIFYKLWEVGTPRLTDEIETACVKFDEEGYCIEFLFNRDLWDEFEDEERLFIICHECLHLILNHGKRSVGVADKDDQFKQQCLNIAMDFVINHMLTFHFNFERKKLGSFFEGLCWIDVFFDKKDTENKEYYYKVYDDSENIRYSSTLEDDSVNLNLKRKASGGTSIKLEEIKFFKHDEESGSSENYITIELGKSFEYYYKKVVEFLGDQSGEFGVNVLDVHNELPDTIVPDGEFYRDPVEDVIEEAADELYENEKKELNEVLEQDVTDEVGDGSGSAGGGAGSESGHGIYFVPVFDESPDYTWETIAENASEEVFKEVEKTSWAKKNRRFSFIDNNDLVLPNTYFKEERVRDNIKVWVFQDVSGSCSKHKDYFFNAITTIPEEKFDIRAFCFSGDCEEMDIESRKLVRCGGGTNFNPMNRKIDHLMDREGCNYPDLVFVITDGRSHDTRRFKRNCKHPERWKMFFPSSHSKRPVMDEMESYLLKNLSKK